MVLSRTTLLPPGILEKQGGMRQTLTTAPALSLKTTKQFNR
jgi:hypothetical protein